VKIKVGGYFSGSFGIKTIDTQYLSIYKSCIGGITIADKSFRGKKREDAWLRTL